jgi:hypothetical protein
MIYLNYQLKFKLSPFQSIKKFNMTILTAISIIMFKRIIINTSRKASPHSYYIIPTNVPSYSHVNPLIFWQKSNF